MLSEASIREIAARAGRQALQEQSSDLAQRIAGKIAAEIGPALQSQSSAAVKDHSPALCKGVEAISHATSQVETLDALLHGVSSLVPRCGILVLRGTQASGWNCLGLTDPENFKRAVIDCSRGPAASVLLDHKAIAGPVENIDPIFAARVGLPNTAHVVLVPVMLRDKTAALLLAVAESNDVPAMQVLVKVAELSLELQGYRKTPAMAHAAAAASPATAERHHAPAQNSIAAAAHASSAPPAHVPPSSTPSAAHSGAEAHDDAHEKARRFAKLLVQEIELYNRATVLEGRRNHDLYRRLSADIDKSRSAYQSRYGASVRDVDYFTQELIRILADNDRSVLGPGYPG